MKSNLSSLYPSVYRDYIEPKILVSIGDKQFDDYFSQTDQAHNNQFVELADEYGVSYWERIYEIKSVPGEDLEFRRERLLIRMNTSPPFTIRFLKERLNKIIGEGKYHAWVGYGQYNYLLGIWKLGEKPFQIDPYVLYIETTVTNKDWWKEVEILVNKIKPAHIVYNYVPLLTSRLELSEEVLIPKIVQNYRLNNSWRLGENPFQNDTDEEVIKMKQTPTIAQPLLNEHAVFTSTVIVAVLLNNSIKITNISTTNADGETTIRYNLPPSSGEITNIKLLGTDEIARTNADVYIAPSAELITIKHIIRHEE